MIFSIKLKMHPVKAKTCLSLFFVFRTTEENRNKGEKKPGEPRRGTFGKKKADALGQGEEAWNQEQNRLMEKTALRDAF